MLKRVSTLDVARGIAIGLVVYAHFLSTSAAVAIPLGNAGVILFFSLSGYLIFKTFDARDYVFKRAFRILPMYWVSVALIYSLEAWSIPTTIANALFLAPPLGLPRMSGVYWTLYVEAAFYAIAPLLIWWPAGARIAPIVLAAMWLRPMTTDMAPFYVAFCLLGFQVGMWRADRLPAWLLALNLTVVAVIASTCIGVGWWLGPIAIACCLILLGAIRFKVSIPPLEWLGRISYSLYLLHAIIGYLVYDLYGAIAAISVSIMASALTYAVIERPFIRLGNHLAERFGVTRKQWTSRTTEVSENVGS